MDYRLPGSSIHGIFQAKVLEWVAIAFSRGEFLAFPFVLHKVSWLMGPFHSQSSQALL